MRDALLEQIHGAMALDSSIFFCFRPILAHPFWIAFAADHPTRFVNVGIAESKI